MNQIPEIHELREYDGESQFGDPAGFWCEGHVDIKKFAIACNKRFELADYGDPVHVAEVKQGYIRKTKEDDEGCAMPNESYLLEQTSSTHPDAIAATFIFY